MNITEQVKELRAKADALEAEANIVETFNEYLEGFDEVVILFKVEFSGDPTENYVFVAVRYWREIDDDYAWAVTGRGQHQAEDTPHMLKALTQDRVTEVWIATDFEQLLPLE